MKRARKDHTISFRVDPLCAAWLEKQSRLCHKRPSKYLRSLVTFCSGTTDAQVKEMRKTMTAMSRVVDGIRDRIESSLRVKEEMEQRLLAIGEQRRVLYRITKSIERQGQPGRKT